MKAFFLSVDTVKADIKEIKHACKKIQSINQDMMLATTADAEGKLSDALNPVLGKANKAAKRCKNTLKALVEETEKLKLAHDAKQANELRIRENLGSTLSRKFVEVVKEYQKKQQDYKDDVKKKVTRQVRIVKEDATEEEIESVMRSGGSTEQLFEQAILTTAADSVKEAFSKAQDKYRDVQRLEQSVMELHQMFIDFALLTEQQGELLDQIEFNVKAAHEYIKDGNVDLEVSIDYQKAIRQKQCCVMITVLIIGIVIMAATGVFGGRRRRRLLSLEKYTLLVADAETTATSTGAYAGSLVDYQKDALLVPEALVPEALVPAAAYAALPYAGVALPLAPPPVKSAAGEAAVKGSPTLPQTSQDVGGPALVAAVPVAEEMELVGSVVAHRATPFLLSRPASPAHEVIGPSSIQSLPPPATMKISKTPNQLPGKGLLTVVTPAKAPSPSTGLKDENARGHLRG